MAQRNTIEILIHAKDEASQVLEGVGKSVQSLGKVALAGLAGLTGAVTGAGAAMVKMASDAASLQGIEEAFDGMTKAAGKSSEEMIKALKEGSAGMATERDVMLSYNKATQLVSSEFANTLPDAMKYLSKIASATGQDMGFMMDSLVTGVGRLSPMILDNLGIQVDMNAANEEYAKSVGKTVDQLSKQEKQTALMAQVMKKLADNTAAMPDVNGQADTMMAQLTATITDMKGEIGKELIPVFTDFLDLGLRLTNTIGPKVINFFKSGIKYAQGIERALRILVTGDFKSGLFGVDEDHPLAIFLFEVRDALFAIRSGADVFKVITKALYSIVESSADYGMIRFANALLRARDIIDNIIQPLAKFLAENIDLKDVLIALGLAIATVVVPAIAAIAAPVVGVVAALVGMSLIINKLRKAFSGEFPEILSRVGNAFKYLFDVITQATNFRNIFNVFEDGSSVLGEFIRRLFGIDTKKADKIALRILDPFNRLYEGLEYKFNQVKVWVGDTFRAIGEIANRFNIGDALKNLDFGKLIEIGRTILSLTNPIGQILTVLKMFGVDVIGTLIEAVKKLPEMLQVLADGGTVWDALRAGFGDTQFIDGIEQAFNGVVNFVQTTVIPGIQAFIDFLVGLWEQVRPGLEQLGNWFITEALPAIVNFIQSTVMPIIDRLTGIISDIWKLAAPFLEGLFNWFTKDALPAVVDFIQNTVMPGVQRFINLLLEMWTKIQPGLQAFADWIIRDALPLVVDFFENVIGPVIGTFIDVLLSIWEVVGPPLGDLFNWFMTDGLPAITGIIQGAMDNFITPFVNLLVGIWEAVKPGLEGFKNGISQIFSWITTNVINPIIGALQNVVNFVNDVLTKLGLVNQQTSTVAQNTANQFGAIGGAGYGIPGFAGGLSRVPYDNFFARLHEGEAVLPKAEAEDWRSGRGNAGGSGPVQIIFQGTGGPTNQQEADDSAYMILNSLYARGVSLG